MDKTKGVYANVAVRHEDTAVRFYTNVLRDWEAIVVTTCLALDIECDRVVIGTNHITVEFADRQSAATFAEFLY